MFSIGEGSFVPLERLEMTPGNQTTIHSIIPNRVVPVKDILPLTLAGKTVKDIYMYVLYP